MFAIFDKGLTMDERYHKALSENIRQTIRDSEENYVNETFWRIYPSFLLVKSGDVEALRESLDIQLDQYDFRHRFTRDERKQLEYMAVSLINTFMIAGIEGGIYPPEANWIADRALHRLLLAQRPSDIPVIIEESAVQLCEKVREVQKKDTGNPHVEKAKHYILTHISQEITAEGIAEHVGLSQYYLSRLFKKLTGQTMMEYLTSERIEAAKQLLTSGERDLQQIAALLRFCDQSHFTQVFRKKTGMTPAEFRRKEKALQ